MCLHVPGPDRGNVCVDMKGFSRSVCGTYRLFVRGVSILFVLIRVCVCACVGVGVSHATWRALFVFHQWVCVCVCVWWTVALPSMCMYECVRECTCVCLLSQMCPTCGRRSELVHTSSHTNARHHHTRLQWCSARHILRWLGFHVDKVFTRT